MSTIDEDALIKSRPLNVEERPFKRLTKRCAGLPPTATPDLDFERFREDIDLDFELFEVTIARIQLLQDTNRREIERYEQEKLKILAASEQARLDMTLLRDSLLAAQQEKSNRLQYDAIATDILSTKALRPPRDEQMLNLARLNQEISELEEERRSYGAVWQARREQFGEIVAQLEKMQEQIQEDKEEHDRREGMDEEEGEEGEEIEHLGATPSGLNNTATGGRLSSSGLGGDRSGAATPSAMSMSTAPSAGQTPLRQVRDVSMPDVITSASGGIAVKTERDDVDRMDTS